MSITQQFNTTTSMGRLTLNVLLSFAQFEREVIGERVRDKIAASKRKGMWMGGTIPLGYDVKDRKLLVNRAESQIVVDIFRRYLRLKSVRALAEELAAAGTKSKRRVRADGKEYGNKAFSHGALYLLLQNRTYRGEVTHNGSSYKGEHAAIVDQELWDAVQLALANNRVTRATATHTKHSSLLTGILFDEGDNRLTPTHTVKKGIRYRYYVSTSLVTGANRDGSSQYRIPAGDLENVVLGRLRTFLSNRSELLDATEPGTTSSTMRRELLEQSRQTANIFDSGEPQRIKAITAMIHRVLIHPDHAQIDVSRSRLAAILAARSTDLPIVGGTPNAACDDIFALTVPVALTRVGREMKILVNGHDDRTTADPSLLRIVARAHDVLNRLVQNVELSVHDVAREERVTSAYLYALLRLPWLAPDITTAIVNGQQPRQLTAKKLMRLTARLPADWTEQRTLLGFH